MVLALLGEPADPALGPRLRAAVAGRAAAWAARHAAPGWALVSTLVGAEASGTRPFAEPPPEEAGEALAVALQEHEGPVVLVSADVPRLDDALAAAVTSDLAAGSTLSFAPATDGRPFLLALARADAAHLALVGSPDRHRDEIFAIAAELGGEIGLLRSERRLVTPADARALAIDPLAPADLRALARSS